ncbi:MAG: family transcriptional regulator [Sphingomonas bacterium]|uniref:helix-turn-helix domain-containing protein n=1 Tax=Sphingomonas bacterium TaxID=1895847 RepID=UPI002637E3B5|nr:helix-turn-helix transcriptional regulator [Sphingomonas bacterium]MDB5707661.1 family transcriptional regulator [Sphingomonas bacterium]
MTGDEQLRRFGERLREARLLTAFNQQEFAALGGVKKNSQVSYETGKTAPTVEYLYRLAGNDIDIGYLLTGRRDDGSQGSEERQLIDMFGKLGAREREAISTMLAILTGNPLGMDRFRLDRPSDTVHAPRQGFTGESDG